MPTVIKSMDYGEGGPDYRIHFEVTYAGAPAQGPSYASGGQPAEAPEWEITGIDEEKWNADCKAYDWVPIERSHNKHEIEAVYSWAELLDLSDEAAEAVAEEHEAYLEQQAEYRRAE